MSIKLVIESSSDINSKEAEKMGIITLPIPISFGNEVYMDGADITREEFYYKLVECIDLPKTSMINSFRFDEAFKEIVDNGDEAVAIVLSSGLSGTYEQAKLAAGNYKGKVFVVDSLSATGGIKILIEYAMQLIQQGLSAKEIYTILEEKKKKIQIIAMVDTLKYLKKGGRVSPLVAFVGELIGVKPMIAVIDGKVEVIGKSIGLTKAMNFINTEINKLGGIDYEMPFYALYSGNDETKIDKFIKDTAPLWGYDANKIRKNCIGATIGTHVGPGAVGVVFFAK